MNTFTKKVALILGSAGILVLIIGSWWFQTNNPKPKITDGTIQVVASFYPMYFFASEIGGDKTTVTTITPPGTEPHDFEPSTRDIAHLQDSDLLVLNGSVESWGNDVRAQLQNTHTRVVVAGEGLLTKELSEDGEVEHDPHIWLDPVLAKQEAHAIMQALVETDPSSASYYEQNEAALDAKFDALHAAYRTALTTCARKDIVTSHSAFAYLAERYGLTQVAIAGLSPDAEPSPSELARVADFARAHAVSYIFFESLVSPKLSESIAAEVGAQTLVLDPIEGISDADAKQGRDYFSLMQDNLISLQRALDCTP